MSSELFKLASRRDAAKKFIEQYVVNADSLLLRIGTTVAGFCHIDDGVSLRTRTFDKSFEVELKQGAAEAHAARGGELFDDSLLRAISAWIQYGVYASTGDDTIQITLDASFNLEIERLDVTAVVTYF